MNRSEILQKLDENKFIEELQILTDGFDDVFRDISEKRKDNPIAEYIMRAIMKAPITKEIIYAALEIKYNEEVLEDGAD